MGCFCEEQSFNLSVWLVGAGGGWRVEESDDFSGTGNLAPHSGVTSQAGAHQRPGDAGGNITHNKSRWEMKWWSSEDVRELQNKEDLIRRCWIFGTQTMLFRNV